MRITASDKDVHLYRVKLDETGEIISDCVYADDERGMYCVLKRDQENELCFKDNCYDSEMLYGAITIEKIEPVGALQNIAVPPITSMLQNAIPSEFDSPEETEKKPRSTWEQYFMDIAVAVASRSSCLRRKVGAVFIKDRRIVATGYNGVPPGIEHCDTYGCIREQLAIPSGQQLDKCRASHAEENAILQAALHGVSLRGCDVYLCGPHPCLGCAKKLITLGVRTVFYTNDYRDEMAIDMLSEAGVELVRI